MSQSIWPLDTPVSYTIAVDAAWTDIDLSATLPSGATGVIALVYNGAGSGTIVWGLRKNGSTDNRKQAQTYGRKTFAMIGVDSNRIVEFYTADSADHTLIVVGYTTSGVTFLTNAVDKSLASISSWLDIDCSASAPSAVGLIFEVNLGANSYTGGLRNNGSTDSRTHALYGGNVRFEVIGCDASQVCEGYISSTAIDYYLVGYITSGATFYVNGTDVSLSTTGSYTDLPALPSGSVFGIYQMISTNGSTAYSGHIRVNGSSSITARMTTYYANQVPNCDSSGLVEGYINSTYMDFYLIGYYIGTANYSQTVSMDALLKSLDNPSTIALDAQLIASDNKLLSLDARVAGRESLTEVIDAFLKGLNIPQTVAVNALVRSADAKTVNLDALVKLTGLSLTTVIDTLVVARTGKTVDLDLLVKALGLTTTVAVSALLRAAGAQSLNADALVSGVESENISLNTLIKLMGISLSVDMDAMLKGLNVPYTVAVDVLTRLSDGKTLSLDSRISGVGTASVTLGSLINSADSRALSIDALVKVLGISTTTALDVLIKLADSRSVYLDAVLSGQGSATIDLNALIKALNVPEIVALDVIIGVPPFQEINIDALIAVLGIERSVALDIVIKESFSHEINLDSFVSAMGVTRIVALDQLLESIDAKSVNVDSLLKSIDAKSANLDILLKSLDVNPNVLLDAMIKGVDLKQITLGALLVSLGVPSTVLIDTLIRSSGTQTLTIDGLFKAIGVSQTAAVNALFRGSSVTVLSLDALVKLLGIPSAVALDAILANAAILKTLSVDAILKAFAESQIALTTLVEDSGSFAVSLDAILFSPVNHRVPVARHSVGRLLPARLNPSRLDVDRR